MISNNPYLFQIIYLLGFFCGSAGKESTFNAGDLGSSSGLGRSPGKEKGYSLQYSGLENSTDFPGEVHGVAKSQTWLSDFHCHKYFLGYNYFFYLAITCMAISYQLIKTPVMYFCILSVWTDESKL